MVNVSRLLDVSIRIDAATREMSLSDLSKMVQSHFLIQQARDDFLAGALTFEEYLALAREHDLNIDSYLDNLDNNLKQVGLIL